MKKPINNPDPGQLRVLILEDNPADAELVEHELRQAGIHFTFLLVEGKREFRRAMADFQPQVILSDFKLPKFDGLAALEMARTQVPDTPFIFVSGSIGEEKAIGLLAQGASDYIFKDNLARLSPAVKRVVEAARLKLENKKTDEELLRRADELRLLAEAADRFVHINDLDEVYDYLAQTIRDISGADYLMLSLYDEKLQAVRPKIVTGFEPFRETIRHRFHIDPMQMVFYLKDMRPDDFGDFVSRRLLPVHDGLYGLANRKVPRSICRLIEKILSVGSMHTMGFSWENQLFGGLTVFFKKDNGVKNASQVEALANLAAVSIKRLLAEQALRGSEERFRHISATISDICYSCLLDKEGAYSLSWMTGAADRITGYTIEEIMVMKCWGKLVLAEDLPDFEKHVNGLIPGNSGNCELRLRHKNGNIAWVQSFAECTQNPEQPEQPILYGGLVDISERKRMYEQLRQSEDYYRTLVETSPDAIIIVDAGGRVTFASQKTLEIFGIPDQATIKGISILDFVEPGEIPRVQGRMVEILSGRSLPEIREYRLLRHDRRPFWGEISSSPLRDAAGRNIGLLLVCRDVSERKRAEAELLREKSFLEKLVEAAPEGIAITDCPGRVLRVNSEFVRMFGYEADEIVGKMVDDLLAPPGYQEEAGSLTKSSGQGEKVVLETVRKRKDGTIINVSIIGAPILIAGQQVAVYAIYRDISERKRADEELRVSAEKWQTTFNSITDIVSVISMDHTFLEINKAGCESLGLERKDIIGNKCYELVHNLHNPLTGCPCSLTMQSKKMEMNEVFENGRYYQLTAWPILDADGVLLAFSHSMKDISERKLAEEQIRAALKEKEVLLQEIHHRVKNNLQIISGLLTLQADQSAGKSLDEIFRASQDRIRSIALIHEKLYRSRNLAEIAFDEYLRALIENLFTSHGVAAGRITVSYEMESILFTIEKAIPLGLIVNELVTNALKHAFPNGRQGEIRIGLQGYKGAKSYALKTNSGTLHCVPTCELTVADNGVGLPAGKVSEQQKSLGMNLVSMLAKQIQAELKVKTGPGTEFSLLFPGLPANHESKDKDHGG
jgi:PAS domain S-box-containing protein